MIPEGYNLIKIKNKNGITLKTANKLCAENITLILDESLFDNNGNEEQSGYTLTLNVDTEGINDSGYTYSLDNGSTWNQFTNATMTLENVNQIKFKNESSTFAMQVGTSYFGTDIVSYLYTQSDNIPVTADTTWYVTITGGGGND
jgi:hypothetical protein